MLRKHFSGLIVLMGAALLCLSAFQYYWITTLMDLRAADIRNQAQGVVEQVLREAEEGFYCVDFFTETDISSGDMLTLLGGMAGQQDTLPLYCYIPSFSDTLFDYPSLEFHYPARLNAELHLRFLLDSSLILDNEAQEDRIEYQTAYSYREPILGNDRFFNDVDSLLRSRLSAVCGDEEISVDIRNSVSGQQVYADTSLPRPLQAQLVSGILFRDNKFTQPYAVDVRFHLSGSRLISGQWVMVISSVLTLVVMVVLIVVFIRKTYQVRKLALVRSEFMQNMIHEYKTPVSNINLAVDTLEKELRQEQPAPAPILSIIRSEISRLLGNLDTILKAISIERREISLDMEPVDMHSLIRNVTDTFPGLGEQGDTRLRLELLAEDPMVMGDTIHLTNVMHNLIDNAIKHSGPGLELRVSTRNERKHLVIDVSDNGKGISESDMPFIFDSFYRVSTGRVHDAKGLGLGLSYVRYIIAQHQGKVRVSSRVGEGSTFSVHLQQLS